VPLLCPDCRGTLDEATVACPNGHRFASEDGLVSLLPERFLDEHRAFLESTALARAAIPRATPADLRALPFGPAGTHPEWGWRRKDLALLLRLLPGKTCRVLDVGAWNGWLSHHLARLGHDVTGVDFWADESDGLGARRHHVSAWRAILMDLIDLSIVDERFDVVILNRCLPFFPDPAAWAIAATRRVAPGGFLVATGLPIHRDPSLKARQVAAARARYRERHGTDLFLRETRGWLDDGDRARLEDAGFVVRPQRAFWLESLKASLRPVLPRICYAVWRG